MGYEDSGFALLCREVLHLRASINECIQAVVTQAHMRRGSICWTADRHAETLIISQNLSIPIQGISSAVGLTYGFENSDGLSLQVVSGEIIGSIVDGNPSSSTSCESRVVDNRHTVVRSVGRMFEIHHGGPVIGEILGHLAGGACSPGADITCHASIESSRTD